MQVSQTCILSFPFITRFYHFFDLFYCFLSNILEMIHYFASRKYFSILNSYCIAWPTIIFLPFCICFSQLSILRYFASSKLGLLSINNIFYRAIFQLDWRCPRYICDALLCQFAVNSKWYILLQLVFNEIHVS